LFTDYVLRSVRCGYVHHLQSEAELDVVIRMVQLEGTTYVNSPNLCLLVMVVMSASQVLSRSSINKLGLADET